MCSGPPTAGYSRWSGVLGIGMSPGKLWQGGYFRNGGAKAIFVHRQGRPVVVSLHVGIFCAGKDEGEDRLDQAELHGVLDHFSQRGET
jgi:hypothetical protein